MKNQNNKTIQFKFANIYLKDMKTKDIKFLWTDFIQVQNYSLS